MPCVIRSESTAWRRTISHVLAIHRVANRFEVLGYSVGDFPPNLKMHKLIRQKTKLTEQGSLLPPLSTCVALNPPPPHTHNTAWNKIRDELEPEIHAIKTEHKLMERSTLKVSRRQMVDKLYAQHKRDRVLRTEWKFMPTVQNVCGPFRISLHW